MGLAPELFKDEIEGIRGMRARRMALGCDIVNGNHHATTAIETKGRRWVGHGMGGSLTLYSLHILNGRALPTDPRGGIIDLTQRYDSKSKTRGKSYY